MNTASQNIITLRDPAEALAAVPHFLGFRPRDSLVVIAMHEASPGRLRCGLTLRMELPAPGHRGEIARYLLRGPLSGRNVRSVFVVIVCDEEPSEDSEQSAPEGTSSGAVVDSPGPPHAPLIDAIHETLEPVGITVEHAVWTPEIAEGRVWRCYDDPDCRGLIGDTVATPLAAAMTTSGSITFGSRDEMRKLVAPESAEALACRSARLDLAQQDREHCSPSECIDGDLRRVIAAIQRSGRGAALTEDDLVDVLLALSDTRVRDLCLSLALTELAPSAEQLWIELARKAPEPELAEVATLLAFFAYVRGDGALAAVALERVETSRPDHRLAGLLRRSLSAGLAPEELASIAREAADDVRSVIDQSEVRDDDEC